MIVRLRHWLQHNSFLASSGMLFVSMTVVNAGNYLFNLLLGRWLGPEAFADLTLIVTLMLIVTLVTSALQLIGAKFAAVYAVEDDRARLIGLRRWLGRWALGGGLAFFVLFTVGAPFWQSVCRYTSCKVWIAASCKARHDLVCWHSATRRKCGCGWLRRSCLLRWAGR
jgi:O-antigen/teichoic acid export membrane protein